MTQRMSTLINVIAHKQSLVQKKEGFVGQNGLIVQKARHIKFFLYSRLGGFKNTRTFVLKEKERFLYALSLPVEADGGEKRRRKEVI